MATATKVKKERKAWHYKDGVKTEFKYTPSGKLSKYGKWARDNADVMYFEYVDMRAIMR